MNTTQTKSDFILDNAFIFLGLGVLVAGIILGFNYELDNEVQNAIIELKQTSYGGLVSMGTSLIVIGYWTMIIGGVLLSILGYSLKRLLK
ncbi:MAG TPA: hypothetical protein VLE02_05150 [Nitrosarchaeum sp.]|nr:hypothetical protein [Nitrosarchaeum sp.]